MKPTGAGRHTKIIPCCLRRRDPWSRQVEAMPVAQLPAGVTDYVHSHYPGAKITEAGKVTDAEGKTRYEAEVKGKDLLFDEKGNFLKFD